MKTLFTIIFSVLFFPVLNANVEIGGLEIGDSLGDIREDKICSIRSKPSEKKYILRYACDNFKFLGEKNYHAEFFFIEKELHKLEILIPEKKLFATKLYLEKKYGNAEKKSDLQTHIDFRNSLVDTLAFSIFAEDSIRLVKRVNENKEKTISIVIISEEWREKKLEFFNKSINLDD